MNALSAIFKPAPHIAYRRISDQVVIVHPVHSRILTLNETGSEIWSRLDGRTVNQIIDEMESEFDTSREQLASDTESFLKSMEEKELIIRCDKNTKR